MRNPTEHQPMGSDRADGAAFGIWQWSLKIYDLPHVKDALLALQDRYRIDINLTLWAIWSARLGYRLDEAAIQAVTADIEAISHYGVARLREVRRFLSAPKPGFPAQEVAELRGMLLDAELRAERLIQQRLEGLTITTFGKHRTGDEEWKAAARAHFNAIGTCLEKPILVVDESKSGAPEELFDQVLETASLVEP